MESYYVVWWDITEAKIISTVLQSGLLPKQGNNTRHKFHKISVFLEKEVA